MGTETHRLPSNAMNAPLECTPPSARTSVWMTGTRKPSPAEVLQRRKLFTLPLRSLLSSMDSGRLGSDTLDFMVEQGTQWSGRVAANKPVMLV